MVTDTISIELSAIGWASLVAAVQAACIKPDLPQSDALRLAAAAAFEIGKIVQGYLPVDVAEAQAALWARSRVPLADGVVAVRMDNAN